ncbi:MAG: FHA domain-containing protein [Actinobacteria bacterium]|nr:FHA domain-containing protein [Actinomycetota bacterium]NDF43466.1 FHA domain-containing protein [Actinomycetota bacterium]
MEQKDNQRDLTRTINMGSLRPVSDQLSILLDKASQEDRDVINALGEGSAMLISLSGPGKGTRFLINSERTVIGRSIESDIFLDDVTVSRKHAEIMRSGKSYSFRDCGSLNGTYLDGKISEQAELKDGSELHIGKYRLHFFVGGRG